MDHSQDSVKAMCTLDGEKEEVTMSAPPQPDMQDQLLEMRILPCKQTRSKKEQNDHICTEFCV